MEIGNMNLNYIYTCMYCMHAIV